MKGAVYSKGRSGKVLEIQDLEPPVPKDDEVLIRVSAASINPLDWRLKSERPGVDVAGHVAAAGAKVTRFRPGDAVFGMGKGTFAEYACAPEARLAAKPENVSFEQAAAVPVAGWTALQGLRDHGHLQAGQRVLINGAAGGIGCFAVQIAKSLGAQVTGVCGNRNVELVRSLGADRVIDYTREDFTLDGDKYDLLLDNVGNRSLLDMKRVLRRDSKCVMAGAPKGMPAVLRRLVEAFAWSLLLRPKFTFFVAKPNPGDLATFGELIQSGKVTPVIDRRYPLTETGSAIAYVEEGHARGKVILTVA